MPRMNPEVDEFIRNAKVWPEELARLRAIVLDSPLTEELKWKQPCYTYQKNNVVILSEFKEYCALGFFKGALLKDQSGVLDKPGEHSQSMRQLRFTSVGEIVELEAIIRAYIYEAIEVEEAGLKIDFKKTAEYILPDELQIQFEAIPALKAAFESLTPGRQRAYILYFSAPKQAKTREARIRKYIQSILDGKGLNDP